LRLESAYGRQSNDSHRVPDDLRLPRRAQLRRETDPIDGIALLSGYRNNQDDRVNRSELRSELNAPSSAPAAGE
jgi:hypothetical protein